MPEHLAICSANDMAAALSAAGAGPMHLAFLRKLLQDIRELHATCGLLTSTIQEAYDTRQLANESQHDPACRRMDCLA